MKTIWKYEIQPVGPVTMKRHAKVLSIGTEKNEREVKLVAWVAVDTDFPDCERWFILARTGGAIPEGRPFLGTVQGFDDGSTVVHVFDGGEV